MNPAPPNPRLQSADLVICDFDGTITLRDTGMQLFHALRLREALEVERRWRRGEIGSPEMLAAQWGLVRLPTEELYALVDSFPLDPDFPRLVALCRERAAGFVIVSDGLDFYLDRMIRRAGFEPCEGDRVLSAENDNCRTCEAEAAVYPSNCIPRYANHAVVSDNHIAVEFPYAAADCPDCGNCKTVLLRRLRPHFRRVIYLGDGLSDLCAAREADLLFAKRSLRRYCEAEGLPHLPFTTLSDVLQELT